MLDVVPAALVFALVVAVGLAVLYGVTVVPFLLTVAGAERRGFAAGRWAAASLVAALVALVIVLLLLRAGAGLLWLALPLALAFAPAAVVAAPGAERFGGRAGRHERPL